MSKCGSDAGGSDDERDEHVSMCGSETTIGTMQGVCTIVAGKKALECRLCRAKSTDPCPLKGEKATKYCGLWPWSKYVRATKGSQLKKAQGRICLICHNVFYSLGLTAKFDTIEAYWKHVTVPTNQNEHQKFLASLKMWIKLYNEDPTQVRIKNRKALENAHTTLEVVSSKGARWKKPKKSLFKLMHGAQRNMASWTRRKL